MGHGANEASSRGTPWPRMIVEMVAVKQRLSEADTESLWDHRLPRVGASEHDLVAVERELGESLDHEYREFLRHAAGWPAFYQSVDLFGPDDLLGGPLASRAAMILGAMDDVPFIEARITRQECLPIAVSARDIDVFVIGRTSSSIPGTVIWLAGGEIDRFVGFGEFFASMIECDRREIDLMRE